MDWYVPLGRSFASVVYFNVQAEGDFWGVLIGVGCCAEGNATRCFPVGSARCCSTWTSEQVIWSDSLWGKPRHHLLELVTRIGHQNGTCVRGPLHEHYYTLLSLVGLDLIFHIQDVGMDQPRCPYRGPQFLLLFLSNWGWIVLEAAYFCSATRLVGGHMPHINAQDSAFADFLKEIDWTSVRKTW